ncbi:MAG: GIY-YIG nuclease family protein [Gammaproteobacteria bacterium]|nr:GIY-YIG nuclease family protein [Gammaproteobacteria bacterium]
MNPFYIYALKDPRSSPARPFYIGKGTGNRAWDHTLRVDATRKGRRIAEIQEQGYEVVTAVLADELTEAQALKLEAELIAAFGTEDTGGLLTNSVMPSGAAPKARRNLTVPAGVVEKAQIGLELLKAAVLELAQANPDGITNSDASKSLGLQSDYAGGSKDYLAWSVLGLLMREGKMIRGEERKHRAVVR